MAKEKSLVEEAIIQMKNLEEAVAENAKGILASTMKEEINELVKESLTEQDEDEIETDIDMELPDMDDEESDDEEGDEMDMDNLDMDDDDSDDEDVIDLTNIKDDEEILRVFKLMGPDDNIVVTKDDSGNINIKDNETDAEYMIVTEGEEDDDEYQEFDESEEFDESDESIESIVERIFGNDEEEEEFSFDDEDEDDEDEEDFEEFDESEELVYEIEMDEQDEEEEDDDMGDEEEPVMESKMSVKPKGTGIGSPKFKYDAKPNQGKGFDVKKKEAPKSVGTGKAKFEYKEGENLDGEFKDIKKAPVKKASVKKVETKEAAHTYGNGSKSGRGLRKGITPNRNLTFENTESNELTILREKNEEYRKALNVFRNKLNEVAVFNSNLAYATRLFTEHSTSKQEKINILRRFDGVENIKESKNLYKVIKDELTGTTSQPMNESLERTIAKAPSTGSAINLIESKTYENPQFLRMKDLMSKLK